MPDHKQQDDKTRINSDKADGGHGKQAKDGSGDTEGSGGGHRDKYARAARLVCV